MKKLVLVLALVTAMALCVTAYAAEPEVLEPTEGKSFVVEYNTGNAGNHNKQYVILILKDGEGLDGISVDSILYIDQAGADEEGKVTFGPFQLRNHTSAQVYIGGWSLDAPINPYYIEVDGIEVSGNIVYQGTYSTATVTLLEQGTSNEVASATTDTSGAYVFDTVQEGIYSLRIEKSGYIKVTKTTVEIDDEGIISSISITGYAGDVDGSCVIDVYDLLALIDDFNKTIGLVANPNCDIDGSGDVNVYDLLYLIENFNVGTIGGITID